MTTPFIQDTNYVNVGGRIVKSLFRMNIPNIVIMDNFLDEEECESLKEMARLRLEKSKTVDDVVPARTSEGMFFHYRENVLIQNIEDRISMLVNWPANEAEPIQVVKYSVGMEYKPHYDFFSNEYMEMKGGKQRNATLIMYLNDPTEGGATTFPNLGIEIKPKQGSALFFSYAPGSNKEETLHAGAPVISGEKWIATKWFLMHESN